MTTPVPDVVLTVGNAMMGDDGAGPLLAEMMTATPVAGWIAIDGGAMPENVAHQVSAHQPRRVLIVDAADMGLDPGEIRLIDPRDIADMFIMSTHNMPLNFLIERLSEEIDEVLFLGIQPDIVGFCYPMTDKVKHAVECVYQRLDGWRGDGGFALLGAAEEAE
ncbi:hydrogenase maturation peptidase HycI [Samsonia erythrinae]|uniref:Hydrogenase 3 maturation peptidase HycL n=1 Tax=Samsonia erythrinae TaxID=160434 RepID=A0A4R3VPJ7_9GAMM|nr:hydrogenase maturation peptidase HycI [Samsonia erythrinae]TCV06284.1 hydrogenase 3 maturation peptidase HycL [Samsonia erythrinae]